MSTNNAIWSEGQAAGTSAELTINGVSCRFRYAPAGTFTMGGTACDHGAHEVTLTKGFWILETPVTQALWGAVVGSNPSKFVGENLPVDSIMAVDADAFVAKLNELGVAPEGLKFALPTEAQWEYACRAGTTTEFSFGDVCDGTQANCDGNYAFGTNVPGPWLRKTTEVGSYPANAWGLTDMHGNVWEFCADFYGFSSTEPQTDPTGPATGRRRVHRGGSWNDGPGSCRSAYRGSDACLRPYPYNGCRIVLLNPEV